MPIASQPRTPIIKVNGSPLSTTLFDRIVDLTVDVSIDRTGSTVLHFADPGFMLFDDAPAVCNVGAALAVEIPDPSGSMREVFQGVVTSVGIEQSAEEDDDDAIPRIMVEACGIEHKLSRTGKIHSYLDMTRAQIVQALASDHGWTSDVEDDGHTFAYLLRTGTDAEFLDALARPIGFEWFVRDRKLHFHDRKEVSGPTLHADLGLMRFSARFQGEAAPAELTVRGWDVISHQEVVGTAKVDDFTSSEQIGSDADFVTDQRRKTKNEFAGELQVSTTMVADGDEASATAKGLAKRMLRSSVYAEGLTLAQPAIVVGCLVTVDGVGKRLGGRYYVTRVVHEYTPGRETRTRFYSDPDSAASAGVGGLAGESGAGGGGHERRHASHPITGPVGGFGRDHLVVGKVTNINDPEKLGRVKVKFPSLGNEDESHWARIVLPGAGNQWGLDLRPELDDEVIVAFEQGDTRAPLVLGGVYSSKHKPAVENPDNSVVAERVWRTRVGHKLILSDGPDGTGEGDEQRHVKIALADGKTSMLVGEDGIRIEAPEGNPIVLKAGGTSLTITDGGDLEIKAKNVKIKADTDIKLEGTKIEGKAQSSAKLESQATVEIKGNASAKLESSGSTVVKGSIVQIN